MIVVLPCYSLEDFSLYRKSSDVDAIFSAWSALYHPALVAHFGEAPRWEPAGSPSSGKARRLIVVPECAEVQLSRSWVKSAEEEGAVVIRHVDNRDEIFKIAFEKLGIDPYSTEIGKNVPAPLPDFAQSAPVAPPRVLNDDERAARDEAIDSFLSVGLCWLLEELLTRKLRYMSNLDTTSFNSRLVEAARAFVDDDVANREKNLQKAFDLLTQAKEYFFPTATKLLDLTICANEEDFAENLPAMLRRRRARKETTNLALPVPALKICRERYPETFALLKEEVEAKRVVLLGADEWEGPLYLLGPLEIARTLIAGRDEYLKSFGVAPTVFWRGEAGYAQILPQLLKLTGYRAAFGRTRDGWTLLEKAGDRSQYRWRGRDGSTIATFCKKSLDATSSEELLQLPDRIGNAYYSDDASSIVFEHRPNAESRWLSDLARMDRYSPVLGKFFNFNEYFKVTSGAGTVEKFVKDQFKTNFLTRSSKRGLHDVSSIWPRRRRLERLAATLDGLETTLRTLTLKSKRAPKLDALFADYLRRSADFAVRLDAALDALDARFLVPVSSVDSEKNADRADNTKVDDKDDKSVEASSVKSNGAAKSTSDAPDAPANDPNDDALFADLVREEGEVVDAARRFVSAALSSGESAKSNGFLFVNSASTPRDVRWETRPQEAAATDSEIAPVGDAPDVDVRTYVGPNGLRQYRATLPAGGVFWLPKFAGFEYRFFERPAFETGSLVDSDLAQPDDAALADAANADSSVKLGRQGDSGKKSTSFLQKIAAKFGAKASEKRSDDADSSGADDSPTRARLAEYVEDVYSAKEVERYYRLRNEFFELKIDPATGSVRRLTTFEVDAPTVSNGLLRQPGRGNRFAWDFALKLPESLLKEDYRDKEDSRFGYTTPAADKIVVLSGGPAFGRLRVDGRMVAPNGTVAAEFCQILTIKRESRTIDVDVEITPKLEPDAAPWDSYFGCRFAWKDSLADLLGGVGATLIWTGRDYLQAPECVDVRSDDRIGITILSAGLPYFKRISDSRLDAILIPAGETKRRFRFGIGVDLPTPQRTALEYAEPEPFLLRDVPSPKRAAQTFLSIDAPNVSILSTRPILDAGSPKISPDATFVGVRVVALETESAATTTVLKSFLPLDRVESVDFTGEVLSEKLAPANGSTLELTFNPRQIRVLNLYFRRAALR